MLDPRGAGGDPAAARGHRARAGLGPPARGRLRLRALAAARRRLLWPLRRHVHHPPEHAARAVAVGLAVALTPTVGVQMPIVLALWAAVRRLRPEWDFNLVVALAWTWVTNVVTAPPVYYLYVLTGRLLLGRWDRLATYDTFADRLAAATPAAAGWLESAWAYTAALLDRFGLPLVVGSLPWTIAGAWVGYRWSLAAIRRYRAARERRRARGGPRA